MSPMVKIDIATLDDHYKVNVGNASGSNTDETGSGQSTVLPGLCALASTGIQFRFHIFRSCDSRQGTPSEECSLWCDQGEPKVLSSRLTD